MQDIVGFLPIGHVSSTRLRSTCRRLLSQVVPPRTSAANDWVARGSVITTFGCAVITSAGKTLTMILRYYSIVIVRQISISRWIRYGGVRALNLGRSDPQIRHILLEIFGQSLASAPIFFTEVPQRRGSWFNGAYLVALCGTWGGIKSNQQISESSSPPGPQCCVREYRNNYWGPYSEIIERADSCIYIHVCAHNCDEHRRDGIRSCVHYQDRFAALPDELIVQILDRLDDGRHFARVCHRIHRVFMTTPESETLRLLIAGNRPAAAMISPPKMSHIFGVFELYISGNVCALAAVPDYDHRLPFLIIITPASRPVHDPDGRLAEWMINNINRYQIKNCIHRFVDHRHYSLVREILSWGVDIPVIHICFHHALDTADMLMIRILCDAAPTEALCVYMRHLTCARTRGIINSKCTRIITYLVFRGAYMVPKYVEEICKIAADDIQVLRALGVWFAREHYDYISQHVAPQSEVHMYLQYLMG